MQQEDLEECYATAIELVKEAGKIVLEGYKTVKEIQEKSNAADLVTEYDIKVEEYLFDNLKNKFPMHKFIGEESEYGKDCESTLSDSPTWIVDPIDGTKNFVHNLPFVAISVALAVNKKSVIAVVNVPAMGKLYTAMANKGAFCNSERIRASNIKDMSKALVNISRSVPTRSKSGNLRNDIDYGLKRCIANLSQGYVSLNSCVVEMCYVAEGSIDASFVDSSRISCWDVAATSLLIQEAGGVVLDSTGGTFDMMLHRVMCAGTQELATRVLKEIHSYIESFTSE